MTQYGFHFNAKRCTGCKTCQLACKDYKNLADDVSFRKVYEYGGGACTTNADGTVSPTTFTYYVSVSCQHCDNPACTKVCPTGAMHKDAETGLVSVDESKCIGCGYCHMACPYNAPKVDRSVGHSVKCDGCKDRVAEGKNPICVEACPLRALEFGPVSEISSDGDRADIAPLPRKSITDPNLYIVEPNHAQPSDANNGLRSADGMVQNYLEVL